MNDISKEPIVSEGQALETSKEAPAPEVKTEEAKPEQSFKDALKENMKMADVREGKTEAKPEQEKPVTKPLNPIAPPGDMSPEMKERFLKLPPEEQKFLADRAHQQRADYARQTEPLRQKAKHYEVLDSITNPHQEYYAKQGIQIPDVVRRAIAWDQGFAKDRLGTAKEFLEAYGIDIYELIDENQQAPQSQPQHIPNMQPEDIERIVEERLQKKLEYQQQEVSTRNSFSEVQKFQESNPLFRDPTTAAQVEAEMAPILEVMVQRNAQSPNPLSAQELLNKAFKATVAQNEMFSRLMNTYEESNRAEKAKAEADKARQHSRSASGSLGGANPVRSGLSFKEELKLRVNGAM